MEENDKTIWLPDGWKIPKTILTISGQWVKGLWWIRVNDYGIHYKNIKLHPPLFSERYGYRKKLKLGRFRFGVLKPIKSIFPVMNDEETKEIWKLYQEQNQYHRHEFSGIEKKKDEDLTITYEEKD